MKSSEENKKYILQRRCRTVSDLKGYLYDDWCADFFAYALLI